MPVINDVQPLKGLDAEATYLVLISPEKIPHLAVVSKGNYYSLTHKKSVVGEPFAPYFNFLKRSQRKMIFLELTGFSLSPEDTFTRFEKANDEVTCLYPVRDFILPESHAAFIFELVPELYSGEKITGAYHINLEDELTGSGDFNLSTYTKEAIFSYIQSLNEKYAKRS